MLPARVPGNGFEQISGGDDPLYDAIFIHHENHAACAGSELFKQFKTTQRLGYIVSRHHQISHRYCLGCSHIQQMGNAHQTHHIVQRLAADGIPGMCALASSGTYFVQCLSHGQAGIQPLHIATRHHHRDQRAIVQMEHVLHHQMFMLLDHTRIAALIQAGHNFFFGYSPARFVLDAQQLKYIKRGNRQQPHKRLGDLGHPRQGPRNYARRGLGVHLADALGYQLAKHNSEESNHNDHRGSGCHGGHRSWHSCRHEPARKAIAESGFAKNTIEHANGSDAHLNGREKLGRIVE